MNRLAWSQFLSVKILNILPVTYQFIFSFVGPAEWKWDSSLSYILWSGFAFLICNYLVARAGVAELVYCLGFERPGFDSRYSRCPLHNVYTDCEARSVFYSMSTGAFFSRISRPRRETDHSPLCSAEVEDVCSSVPPLHHTSAWRSALLSTSDNLALPLTIFFCISWFNATLF
jgi:hypothetical protein